MVKFHVEIFGTPLFQNGTPIFQMGLLFLEKEESLTPTFEIQVRTLQCTQSMGLSLTSVITAQCTLKFHNMIRFLQLNNQLSVTLL